MLNGLLIVWLQARQLILQNGLTLSDLELNPKVNCKVITARQLSCGKMMISFLFVCPCKSLTPSVPPPPRKGPWTCSNLYNLELTVHGPPPRDMFKLVHYKPQTLGKQAVGIRLNCLLISN